MRIGINGNRLVRPGNLEAIVEHARGARRDGIASYWLAQDPTGSCDALTALTIVATRVPEIELATGVVPTWPRHPAALAAQALTVNQASRGRLTLGIGLSHRAMMESVLGIPFERPIRHMKDYLSILAPLLEKGSVDYQGESASCHTTMDRIESRGPALLVAALGPQMLRLAGSHADGTVVTFTGPKTIRDHIKPTLERAAEEAGRPRPRLAAIFSLCVTDDVEGARERADEWFERHGHAPSYDAMLEREGVTRASDIQLLGDEAEIERRFEELAEIGVDEIVVGESAVTPEEAERTRAHLITMAEKLA
ncbi:MAG: TIGR03564 family F420-dependent LLM class oxidoreductase [Deltaproteobacteria bacterium]|nr:TIGR03564 family F420-dependent LLM class oxidoreductase [Deltaproteobacteria bacterium]MBW2495745.1 TIGR03564 family F420-dependent LLM class oxidoreductase [Deltaproteobacteria bacterium]